MQVYTSRLQERVVEDDDDDASVTIGHVYLE